MLLTLVVAILAFLHSGVHGFQWPLVIVDGFSVAAMLCFVNTVRLGLAALGSLIIAADSAEREKEASALVADERARAKAMWAECSFKGGIWLTFFTGVAAAIVLNWISASDACCYW